jgi:hypothetical protein
VVHDQRYANLPTMSMPWYGDLCPVEWGQ